jgi:ankyrin repeat domain-containing protein 50
MKSLRCTLDSLPETLDETYCRILDKVNKYDQPLVQHILQCVCFFFRPISAEELGHIYRIGDRRKPPFDSEEALFYPEDVTYLCGGLLCLAFVDDWDGGWDSSIQFQDIKTVQLAHFSVKEYLISARAMFWRLDEELSHLYIVKAGIAYYLEFMASEDVTIFGASLEEFHRSHSLAVYCASQISHHLFRINPRDHPDLTTSFQYLLTPTQSTLGHKIGLWCFYDWLGAHHRITKAEPLEVSTLRIAAHLGLPVICQWLLSINTLPQISSTLTEPGFGSLLLAEAVAHRSVDMLRVLVNAGADMNGTWSYQLPPLHTAVLLRSREIVEVLLKFGADVNVQDQLGGTPTDLAIWHGCEDIVKILRDAGGRPSEQSEVSMPQ